MTGCLTQRGLGRADLAGTRALVATLDLEAHVLIAREVFEGQRTIESTAMEEILLSILGGDEAEAAFGDDLLYGTSHSGLSSSFSLAKQTQRVRSRRNDDHERYPSRLEAMPSPYPNGTGLNLGRARDPATRSRRPACGHDREPIDNARVEVTAWGS